MVRRSETGRHCPATSCCRSSRLKQPDILSGAGLACAPPSASPRLWQNIDLRFNDGDVVGNQAFERWLAMDRP
jgi:hypothetical protein